jgi:RNA polymerase sigma-70 factor (ECF subfamily)
LAGDAVDEELVRAVVGSGDEAAFRLLYRRHTPALFRVALRLQGGDRTRAEEAVQEAWIRAVARLAGFLRESSLRTWLTGILINCCRESRRAFSREAASLEAHDEPRAGPATALAIDLERAIEGLAAGYRHVLVLHDVMGYTHKEIASLLDVEEGTSKSQLHLARRAVRRALAGGRGSEEGHA